MGSRIKDKGQRIKAKGKRLKEKRRGHAKKCKVLIKKGRNPWPNARRPTLKA